jgi:hypothetical protein
MSETLTLSPTAEAFASSFVAAAPKTLIDDFAAREVKRFTDIIQAPPSDRRARIIHKMEHRAAAKLGLEVGQVDWPNLTPEQWLHVIQVVVSIIGILLML